MDNYIRVKTSNDLLIRELQNKLPLIAMKKKEMEKSSKKEEDILAKLKNSL